MEKIEKMILVAVLFLIVLFSIIVMKFIIPHDKAEVKDVVKDAGLEPKIEEMRRDQMAMKIKLENVERMLRENSSKAAAPRETQAREVQGPPDNRYVTDLISAENVADRAVWRKTNKPGVYMVIVKLAGPAEKSTVIVTTSKGVMPENSFNVIGTELSMVFQEAQEQFIASKDFIQIRYIPVTG